MQSHVTFVVCINPGELQYCNKNGKIFKSITICILFATGFWSSQSQNSEVYLITIILGNYYSDKLFMVLMFFLEISLQIKLPNLHQPVHISVTLECQDLCQSFSCD